MNRSVLLFALLVVTSITLAYLTNLYILTDDVYFYYLQNQISSDKIDEIISFRNEWIWIGYVTIPMIYLVKITLVTFCIFIGVFLCGYSVKFGTLFSISLTAEFVYLLSPVITLIWFGIFKYDYTLDDLETFYPLSIINLLDPVSIPSWLNYPLSVINVFELLYVLVLSHGIAQTLDRSYMSSVKLVSVSYGSGLTLWVLLVTFFIVNQG